MGHWTSPKVFALWVFMVPGLGSLGMVVASWMFALPVAIAHDGWAGVAQIPVESAVIARIPEWIQPGPPPNAAYAIAFLCQAILMILGAATFGRTGERLYRFVVVKLRWLTREEVDAARKREQQFF
jgi:hypothetical protein